MRHLLVFAFLAAAWLCCPARAAAPARVQVSHAWIRLLPGDLPAGGYATLTNPGDTPATLVGVSSSAYAHVMLHKSSTEGGMSRMAMVGELTIPAEGKLSFAPGGYHLMLMHANRPLRPGDSVTLTLKFADGSTQDARFVVRPANATGDND